MGEEYRSRNSLLWSFLHSPVTSSLLGPNTILNTLFSTTLSLRSSLNEKLVPGTLNLLVTRCTNKFNIQQLYVLPTLYSCVL
jgi:hypothetical protein